jgi:hypothetical protein
MKNNNNNSLEETFFSKFHLCNPGTLLFIAAFCSEGHSANLTFVKGIMIKMVHKMEPISPTISTYCPHHCCHYFLPCKHTSEV